MKTVDNQIIIPSAETQTAPKASKPKAKEGNGGKGNVLPSASKAQLAKQFASDSGALASVLVALGCVERIQESKHGVTCRRIYGDLQTILANRSNLGTADKKLASAAIDALQAVGALRGKFISLELFRNSVAVRSRKEAGKFHKQAK